MVPHGLQPGARPSMLAKDIKNGMIVNYEGSPCMIESVSVQSPSARGAATIYNYECVGLQLPLTAELRVTQCDPGVRGNSATCRTKPATLETGLVVQVPEYLAQGEMVKVDTRSGEFLSRV